MLFKLKSMPLTLLLFLFVGITSCTSKNSESVMDKYSGGEIRTIELEDMELTSAEIVTVDSANVGKAVKMLSADAMATTKITLPEGQYAMGVFFMPTGLESDGFFLVADTKAKRTFWHMHNEWKYGMKFIIFKSDGVNPVTLRVASAWEGHDAKEFGMVIDRLEIIEFCSSASVLEKWTD